MGGDRGAVWHDGVRLCYERTGSGKAVVFIHGFALDLRMWDPQWTAIAENYQVVRYDLRGFGASDPPDGKPYRHIDDLRTLLDAFDIERAALVGLSMGGGIAIDFALAHPDRVRGVAALASTLGGYHWERQLAADWGATGRRAREAGVAAARREWVALPQFEPARARREVAAALETMVEDFAGWPWLHRDPGVGLAPPAIDRLGELRCPVLALVGDRDLPDFQAIAALLERNAPRASRVMVPDTGHLVNMEAAGACNAGLLRFLAGLDAGGGARPGT